MVNCTVLRCNNRSEQSCEDVSFHRYPSDEEIREKWILATGRPRWRPMDFHRICSKHFEQECFQRNNGNKAFLHKLATPTLFVHTKAQSAEPGSSKGDPMQDSDGRTSPESNEQELLVETVRQCRFCGSYGTEYTEVSYLPYLNNRKTSIVFNEISIHLDFRITNLPTAVCDDCNDKLLEMRDFITRVKETQERLHFFKPETNVKRKNKVKKAADNAKVDAECTNKRIINNDDDDEDTRDAFEDEDLICDVPEDQVEPEKGIEEVIIKTEHESDDNDTKVGILDCLTLEETVVLRGTKITKGYTIRKKDTKEGMFDSLPAKVTVLKDPIKTTDTKRKKDKEVTLDSVIVKDNVVSKGSKRAKDDHDTTNRKKVKVEEESVEFDIAIEEEVTTTEDENKGYTEFGASVVGTTSAPKKVNYITIDGLTGTFSVEQGNKRKE